MLTSRLSSVVRNFTTTAIRRGGDHHVTLPGDNLPFQTTNRFRLTAVFIIFFGSGLAAPFLILRHQLLKK